MHVETWRQTHPFRDNNTHGSIKHQTQVELAPANSDKNEDALAGACACTHTHIHVCTHADTHTQAKRCLRTVTQYHLHIESSAPLLTLVGLPFPGWHSSRCHSLPGCMTANMITDTDGWFKFFIIKFRNGNYEGGGGWHLSLSNKQLPSEGQPGPLHKVCQVNFKEQLLAHHHDTSLYIVPGSPCTLQWRPVCKAGKIVAPFFAYVCKARRSAKPWQMLFCTSGIFVFAAIWPMRLFTSCDDQNTQYCEVITSTQTHLLNSFNNWATINAQAKLFHNDWQCRHWSNVTTPRAWLRHQVLMGNSLLEGDLNTLFLPHGFSTTTCHHWFLILLQLPGQDCNDDTVPINLFHNMCNCFSTANALILPLSKAAIPPGVHSLPDTVWEQAKL